MLRANLAGGGARRIIFFVVLFSGWVACGLDESEGTESGSLKVHLGDVTPTHIMDPLSSRRERSVASSWRHAPNGHQKMAPLLPSKGRRPGSNDVLTSVGFARSHAAAVVERWRHNDLGLRAHDQLHSTLPTIKEEDGEFMYPVEVSGMPGTAKALYQLKDRLFGVLTSEVRDRLFGPGPAKSLPPWLRVVVTDNDLSQHLMPAEHPLMTWRFSPAEDMCLSKLPIHELNPDILARRIIGEMMSLYLTGQNLRKDDQEFLATNEKLTYFPFLKKYGCGEESGQAELMTCHWEDKRDEEGVAVGEDASMWSANYGFQKPMAGPLTGPFMVWEETFQKVKEMVKNPAEARKVKGVIESMATITAHKCGNNWIGGFVSMARRAKIDASFSSLQYRMWALENLEVQCLEKAYLPRAHLLLGMLVQIYRWHLTTAFYSANEPGIPEHYIPDSLMVPFAMVSIRLGRTDILNPEPSLDWTDVFVNNYVWKKSDEPGYAMTMRPKDIEPALTFVGSDCEKLFMTVSISMSAAFEKAARAVVAMERLVKRRFMASIYQNLNTIRIALVRIRHLFGLMSPELHTRKNYYTMLENRVCKYKEWWNEVAVWHQGYAGTPGPNGQQYLPVLMLDAFFTRDQYESLLGGQVAMNVFKLPSVHRRIVWYLSRGTSLRIFLRNRYHFSNLLSAVFRNRSKKAKVVLLSERQHTLRTWKMYNRVVSEYRGFLKDHAGKAGGYIQQGSRKGKARGTSGGTQASVSDIDHVASGGGFSSHPDGGNASSSSSSDAGAGKHHFGHATSACQRQNNQVDWQFWGLMRSLSDSIEERQLLLRYKIDVEYFSEPMVGKFGARKVSLLIPRYLFGKMDLWLRGLPGGNILLHPANRQEYVKETLEALSQYDDRINWSMLENKNLQLNSQWQDHIEKKFFWLSSTMSSGLAKSSLLHAARRKLAKGHVPSGVHGDLEKRFENSLKSDMGGHTGVLSVLTRRLATCSRFPATSDKESLGLKFHNLMRLGSLRVVDAHMCSRWNDILKNHVGVDLYESNVCCGMGLCGQGGDVESGRDIMDLWRRIPETMSKFMNLGWATKGKAIQEGVVPLSSRRYSFYIDDLSSSILDVQNPNDNYFHVDDHVKVSLAVSPVQYQLDRGGRVYEGLASSYFLRDTGRIAIDVDHMMEPTTFSDFGKVFGPEFRAAINDNIKKRKPILLFGMGTGIMPLVSVVRFLSETAVDFETSDRLSNIWLVIVAKDYQSIPMVHELERYRAAAGIRMTVVLSRTSLDAFKSTYGSSRRSYRQWAYVDFLFGIQKQEDGTEVRIRGHQLLEDAFFTSKLWQFADSVMDLGYVYVCGSVEFGDQIKGLMMSSMEKSLKTLRKHRKETNLVYHVQDMVRKGRYRMELFSSGLTAGAGGSRAGKDGNQVPASNTATTFFQCEEILAASYTDGKSPTERCLVLMGEKVYDITTMVEKDLHPAGSQMLVDFCGHDISQIMTTLQHSEGAYRQMEGYYMGDVVFSPTSWGIPTRGEFDLDFIRGCPSFHDFGMFDVSLTISKRLHKPDATVLTGGQLSIMQKMLQVRSSIRTKSHHAEVYLKIPLGSLLPAKALFDDHTHSFGTLLCSDIPLTEWSGLETTPIISTLDNPYFFTSAWDGYLLETTFLCVLIQSVGAKSPKMKPDSPNISEHEVGIGESDMLRLVSILNDCAERHSSSVMTPSVHVYLNDVVPGRHGTDGTDENTNEPTQPYYTAKRSKGWLEDTNEGIVALGLHAASDEANARGILSNEDDVAQLTTEATGAPPWMISSNGEWESMGEEPSGRHKPYRYVDGGSPVQIEIVPEPDSMDHPTQAEAEPDGATLLLETSEEVREKRRYEANAVALSLKARLEMRMRFDAEMEGD